MKKIKILKKEILGSLIVLTPIVALGYYRTEFSSSSQKKIHTALRTKKNLNGFAAAAASSSSSPDNKVVEDVLSRLNHLNQIIYFGTNEGLKKLEGGRLTIIDQMDLTDGFVFQAKDKTIYFGSEQGLKKYHNGVVTTISQLRFQFGYMLEAQDGTLYVGAWGDGLNKISNDKLIQINSLDIGGGFMYQTQDGTIYVGAYKSGLRKLVNNRLEIISSVSLERSFSYQTQDGTVYIGTWANGLKKIASNGSLVQVIPNDVGTGFMYQTQDGTIYVGTFKDGLKKLANGQAVNVDSTSMESGFMYQTQDGTIYVGTSDGSLKKLVNGKLEDASLINAKVYFILANQNTEYPSTSLASASTTLPSSLKNATTAAALGFVDPSVGKRNGATVSFAVKSANNQNGTIEIEATVTKGGVSKTMIFKLRGFQTQAEVDKNIVDNVFDLFNNLKNPQHKSIHYVGAGKSGLKKLNNKKLLHIDSTSMESGFMYQTQDGTIYVGASDGSLNKIVNGKMVNLLPGEAGIIFMYQTQDGTIYIGSEVMGLMQIVNGKVAEADFQLQSYDVLFMHEANDGSLYFATEDGKLEKFKNNRKKLIKNIDLDNGFFYQTQDGTIYVGTKSAGLKKIVNDKLIDVNPVDVGTGFMYQTQDGTVYVGTRSSGIKKLDNDGNLIDVNSVDVSSGFMHQTQDKTIYVGTKSAGLKKLDNDGNLIDVNSVDVGSGFIYFTKGLTNTTLVNASTTLPNSLKNATTAAALGFVDPSVGKRDGATVSFAIKSVDDHHGLLEVEVIISKGQFSKKNVFKLKGFQTKYDANKKANEDAINIWNALAVSGKSLVLPSKIGAITNSSTLKVVTGLTLPTLSSGATVKITATPNDTNGTIELAIVISTPGATKPSSTVINKVLTGFQTQADANKIKADTDQKANEDAIKKWNGLVVVGEASVLPSKIGTITDGASLSSMTGLALPALSSGATTSITATPNDTNGTINLAIVVSTPGATKPSSTVINKVLTGFQTQADANKIKADADQKANESAIKKWNGLAVSGKTLVLPSSIGAITNSSTLKVVIGLTLPTLSSGATVKITATPNNKNGTIELAIVISTPGATNPTSNSINKVLTGFQTQAQANKIKADADQKANEDAIKKWNGLAVIGEASVLPSKIGTITDGSTLNSMTGLTLPALSSGATTSITATPNDTNGTINLAIVVSTPGATKIASTVINKVLTGFQTQADANKIKADADQKANESAIKKWNGLAVSGKTLVLPSSIGAITNSSTLKVVIGLTLPTLSSGATVKITATPNNKNGTIELAIVISTPGATNPTSNSINKVLTGFQTQAQANKIKADADQKSNEDAIKKWNSLAVVGEASVLPSKIGTITDGASLSSATGLTLPTLKGGATVRITATPNDTNGTINLAIVVSTPGATKIASTVINKVLTGFQTQANADQKSNEDAIKKWNGLVVSGKTLVLPSKIGTITDGSTLNSMTGLTLPALSSGATTSITATPNDTNGTINLAIVVSTPGATKIASTVINKVLTGFQTQVQVVQNKVDADQKANESAINNWNALAVSGKTLVLPSSIGTITDGSTLKVVTGLTLPTLSSGATVKITATPNNKNGTIELAIVISTPGATNPTSNSINKVLTGFQTQAQANKIKADADQKSNEDAINKWNGLAVVGEASILSSKIGTITDGASLSNMTGLTLPALKGGATVRITAKPNDKNGTINLAIVVSTPGATKPASTVISKVLTGFQTQAQADKIKADADQKSNEDAINKWNGLAVSGKTLVLPSSIGAITNSSTLKVVTGLTLPTLSSGATVKITATPNNKNGTIELAIVISTPGATNPTSNSINKVLTGFQTQAQANKIKADADQKSNEDAIKKWNSLAVVGEASVLPSKIGTITDGASLSNMTGLTLPALKGGTTANITATPNNKNGTIELAIVISTPGATKPASTVISKVLTGFQTQAQADKIKADADQKSNEDAIKKWNGLAVSGKTLVLPSNIGAITNSSTLKVVTGLTLPTLSSGATVKITATPNNKNGTIELAIVISTPGATNPTSTTINKVLTGFQTQADANKVKADADQKSNEDAINKWNGLAVVGEASILSSKIGTITDGASLSNMTGLTLPALKGGATVKIAATPNDKNGTINLAIVISTPGATKPASTVIHKVLTGFKTKVKSSPTKINANEMKANLIKKVNEVAINHWKNLEVNNKANVLPSTIGVINDSLTLNSMTGLTLPALKGGATANITATPNNKNGTIELAIVISTPGATSPTSTTIIKVLTGFETTEQKSKLENAIKKFTIKPKNSENNMTQRLPSSIAALVKKLDLSKKEDLLKFSKYTRLQIPDLPSDMSINVVSIEPNDKKGQIDLQLKLSLDKSSDYRVIKKSIDGFKIEDHANGSSSGFSSKEIIGTSIGIISFIGIMIALFKYWGKFKKSKK